VRPMRTVFYSPFRVTVMRLLTLMALTVDWISIPFDLNSDA